MGEQIQAAPVAGLAGGDRILSEDVAMLRGEVFRDGVVTRAEAESLFALDARCRSKCVEWPEFFVEAITDYLVHQEIPRGYVTEEKAAWLKKVISRDGRVDTATELELLIRVIEAARSVPQDLSAYALEQVANAVIDGNGPLAGGADLVPGVIGRAEVDLLRRILYGAGGEGGIAISRAEAEVLFRLNDRTSEAANDAAWSDLFVKAIANCLMYVSGYAPPPREVALRRETFLDDANTNVAGFIGRMFREGFRGVLDAYSRDASLESAHAARNGEHAFAVSTAERISLDEARWLAERIGRDGMLHENEKALLAFLKRESPDIHPELRPLLDRVA